MSAPNSICEQAGGVISPGNPCVLSPQDAATGLGDWVYLINHRPTDLSWEIHNRIPDAPDPGYHAIEDAGGSDCNLDFYPVQILEWPKPNNVWPALDTTPMSTKDIVNNWRWYVDEFVDSAYAAKFTPYDPDYDQHKWASSSPADVLGTVISIKMLMFSKAGPLNPDNGSVITSECAENHWIFSTLWTPADKAHPVSGNRQFGISTLRAGESWSDAYSNRGESKGVTFVETGADMPYVYIRGVDRPTGALDAAGQSTIFKSSDSLWSGFQTRMAKWITDRGGKAHIPGSVWRQVNWNDKIKGKGLWTNHRR
jgi:hypothetical protein